MRTTAWTYGPAGKVMKTTGVIKKIPYFMNRLFTSIIFIKVTSKYTLHTLYKYKFNTIYHLIYKFKKYLAYKSKKVSWLVV